MTLWLLLLIRKISPTFTSENVKVPLFNVLADKLPNAASLRIKEKAAQPVPLLILPAIGPPFHRYVLLFVPGIRVLSVQGAPSV